ncbi:sulfurtransferase [Rhodothermus profundi]|uniref:Sulfurtransferase n=1 Tax=Rhodothermus profundi TaxID=633813 RepID=A0A1M6Q9I7_9BACT|nr:sulfurtransferase [Rhodothermus profundi]SHK16912.1 thiosulfate/3-mercaptopyruvate sulfurtransferase [Rhodothermus profundi]
MAGYAHPEALVSTDWVAAHLSDTEHVRLVESDEDVLLYETGHIPNAVKIDWVQDLQDPIVRDYINKEQFEALCAARGISNDMLVVFYGDKNNWWACYAFWIFKLFGHERCAIMDGGRQKWIAEGRLLTRAMPSFPRTAYQARDPDLSIRAFRDEVQAHMQAGKPLIDVRTPAEYRGELVHMPDYPQEGALRAGHIPGAQNVPWSMAVREDGTFKSREELERIYLREKGLCPEETVITYCRIGERSSHTWFVLKYLLGFAQVKNYDGSWTEWGNLVGVPIERGDSEASRTEAL